MTDSPVTLSRRIRRLAPHQPQVLLYIEAGAATEIDRFAMAPTALNQRIALSA